MAKKSKAKKRATSARKPKRTAKKKSTRKSKPAAKKKSVKKKPKRAAKKRSIRSVLAIATSAKQSVKARVSALAESPLAVCEKDDHLQAVLGVLADKVEPLDVRLAALQTLQAASFSTVAFEPCRKDYIATLRKVSKDPDPELRERAFSVLATEKDGYAQKALLKGLEDSDKALVAPEKALQLLSYDVHSDAYAVARKIVKKPPNETAKREALRLLAADAGSAKMFEKVLRNKKETAEIRQISAAALHAIKPETLYSHAKKIVLDKSEDDDVQATCLTALSQFADESTGSDKALMKRVQTLKSKASSQVKKSARQFLRRYEQ